MLRDRHSVRVHPFPHSSDASFVSPSVFTKFALCCIMIIQTYLHHLTFQSSLPSHFPPLPFPPRSLCLLLYPFCEASLCPSCPILVPLSAEPINYHSLFILLFLLTSLLPFLSCHTIPYPHPYCMVPFNLMPSCLPFLFFILPSLRLPIYLLTDLRPTNLSTCPSRFFCFVYLDLLSFCLFLGFSLK